jgi:hypothetical protein
MGAPMSAAAIAKALGGYKTGRGFMVPCPCHRDRTPSLSVADGRNGVLVFCFAGCLTADVIASLKGRGLWESNGPADRQSFNSSPVRRTDAGPRPHFRVEPKRSDEEERLAYVRKLWRQAKDPHGTLAEIYLARRNLNLPRELAGRCLRFHPHCPWEKSTVPALIAAFHPIAEPDDDSMPVGLLRIGLTDDGGKLGKKMLGPVAGAAIKLDHDESVEQGLFIAEGLETALACRQRDWRPMWCLGSEGGIRRLPPLSGLCLTIAADHDSAGLSAAQACAERWAAAGNEVFIRWPAGLGRDFAD